MPSARPPRPALLALALAMASSAVGLVAYAAPATAAVAAADLGGGSNPADLAAYSTATVSPPRTPCSCSA